MLCPKTLIRVWPLNWPIPDLDVVPHLYPFRVSHFITQIRGIILCFYSNKLYSNNHEDAAAKDWLKSNVKKRHSAITARSVERAREPGLTNTDECNHCQIRPDFHLKIFIKQNNYLFILHGRNEPFGVPGARASVRRLRGCDDGTLDGTSCVANDSFKVLCRPFIFYGVSIVFLRSSIRTASDCHH